VRVFLRAIRRRIAIKLTLTLVGFVAVTMLAAGLYIDRAFREFAAESLEAGLVMAGRALHDETRALIRRGAGPAELHAFVERAARATGSRVTVITPDGRVIAESERTLADLPRIENQGERPEVRAALGGSIGRDLRRTGTTEAPLFYVALSVREDGRVTGVLRLALPPSAATSSYASLRQVLVAGGLLALAVAFAIGIVVAGRVTRPVVEMQAIARRMSEGNFRARAPARSPDEIGALGRALNLLAARLRDKIQDFEQEQAKATAILDGMVEGVIAVDGHEHIVLMNERARAIFGLGAERVTLKPFLEVIRNADLHEIFKEGRRAGDAARRELRLSAPVERVLQVHAVPLRLGADEPGLVIVLHDVTALRRLEQVRTEFVANVSHELRTPLTAIHGYLETLLGGALEEPDHARRFLEIVFRHTERLGRLLDDLTDLSNIELGKVSLQMGPTRLAEVVESVLAIIRPRAESRRVQLLTALPPDLPAVHADRDRLAQILINLVDNAVKYTPEGGLVTVAARPAAGAVEVEVRDTGAGIPPADLPRITERFYRVDKARSRALGGTGLGLAIVKHLVVAHGGELKIESVVDRGTVVRFPLPISSAEAARPA
jgi:two-component system phosphate regulon sensor histidine kinase PhoR